MTKRVVIIEDDELFRDGLRHIVDNFDEFKVIHNFSIENFLKWNLSEGKVYSYDLIIINPPSDFQKYVSVLKILRPYKVMVLTNNLSKRKLVKAIENGVSAFYTKKILLKEFHESLVDLSRNYTHKDVRMSAEARDKFFQVTIDEAAITKSEFDVLDLVCEQKNSIEIAEKLNVSVRTVESRKRNMMRKTNCKNMVGVVVIYVKYLQELKA